MDDNSRMFDEDSFTDEIQTVDDAQECVSYLSSNERNFRRALIDEGISHEEEEESVAKVWRNLIGACERVGFSDIMVTGKKAQFGA